jgi:transposase
MKRFIEGADRSQSVLFPERLDEYIGEDNPVRAIDVFVDTLDLQQLGFDRALGKDTGRPGYHPATLLKIYLYGYLNRIQSSRRLERESQRNVELIWLTGRLSPDFKTIADFRRDNGPAITQVCKQFILICRNLNLFTEAMVAIDGSKFKAVNTRDKNFTEGKLRARMRQVEESISRYLGELDRSDRDPTLVSKERVGRLNEKISQFRAQMQQLDAIGEQMRAAPDNQVSLSDPDSRSMATHGTGTGIVGYNVQAAVDTTHHLIVAHEVVQKGHDRHQLAPMANLARSAIGSQTLTAFADRGYYTGEQIVACEEDGIQTLVPKPQTSPNKALGLFDRRDFIYLPEKNEFQCPAGQRAIYRFTSVEDGKAIHKYWSSACTKCSMKPQCTKGIVRKITRWEHEAVLERMQERLDRTPEASKIRRRTVEHTFGTLKAWMGATHFTMKTLPRVRTEMSLYVLAYNMKRMMQIIGVRNLIEAMRAA